MPVLRNIAALTSGTNSGKQGEVFSIANAALAWRGEKISWLGAEKDLPAEFSVEKQFDAHGALVIPGLIDCHTHLAFGGWRTEEFVQRCLGKSYSEIAQQGGGILSTVRQTRDISKSDLEDRCVAFLKQIAAQGTTTIEAKSGYGLDVPNEIKILEVYAGLRKKSPVSVIPTLLAAHTVPAEFKSRREEYVELILEQIIPQVSRRKLARFCDVFVDEVAFSNDEARRILRAARDAGMRSKLHVDQLADGAGGALAAELGAISADHLEFVSAASINAMRDAGVVAVVLPLASIFTRQAPLDARRLIEAGVQVAVATDFNPGSAPSFNLPLAMMLSCTLNRLSPSEAFTGATIVAAKALGIEANVGSLEVGKQADFALLAVPNVEQWLYHFTSNVCAATVKGGVCIAGVL